MTEPADARTLLETELIFGVRKRERFAWAVAGGAILIGIGGVAVALGLLPLKTTESFLVIVDKDTGLAQRTVQVGHATVEQADAVKQSLLYNYLIDRETYDAADNDYRIKKVYRQSSGPARQSLRELWTEGHPNFPPLLYGDSGKVTVDVLNVTEVAENTAQIRFTKTLRRPGEEDMVGKFVATVSYAFTPSSSATLQLLWENPFGFTVTDYRITAEQMGVQK